MRPPGESRRTAGLDKATAPNRRPRPDAPSSA